MNISETTTHLTAQKNFSRTSKGRSISANGIAAIDATLADTKNWGVEAAKCKNCGIILSSLVISNGCPNCGQEDFTTSIGANEILK